MNQLNNTWQKEYPQFQPDYSPIQMFELGIFRGAYFHNNFIENILKRKIQDCVPNEFLKHFPNEFNNKSQPFLNTLNPYNNHLLNNSKPDININKFKVQSGSDYDAWRTNGWIDQIDPYGWVNWYINFYYGRRCHDDSRQIGRWSAFKGRHSGTLRRTGNPKDLSHGFKTRQNMLHWAIDSSKII